MSAIKKIVFDFIFDFFNIKKIFIKNFLLEDFSDMIMFFFEGPWFSIREVTLLFTLQGWIFCVNP